MDVKNILIADTYGDLSKDLFKNYPGESALTVEFGEDSNKRVLNFTTNNIKFDSIPNIHNSTYIEFLAYNGTLGYSNKVFSTVVKQEQGLFNVNTASTMTYNPDNVTAAETQEELDNTVIDIKMFNGTIDVLTYSEGTLAYGEKTYTVSSRRAYPTTITEMPNVSNNTVFLDGWYSYTKIIFRDLSIGELVTEGSFYGIDGFIFKASDDGYLFRNETTDTIYILKEGDTLITDGIEQKANVDYEELLFSLNETSGISPQANNIYLHSQLLINDELRDAINAEIICANCSNETSGCDFADWQQLMLKRLAASIMFQNELYENAQIIIETSREMCLSAGGDNCF